MPIIHRYLVREVVLHFVTVTGVLFVILVSSQLAKVLTQAATNQFPIGAVLSLLGLMSLRYLPNLVPLGLFLGAILALGRLYHDSEVTAMQACGIGIRRLCVPVLAVACSIALLLAGLALWIGPHAVERIQDIRAQALRDARLASLEPQRFRSIASDAVYYAERVDENGMLHNVFVQRRVGEEVEVVVAPLAEQRGAGQEEQAFVLYKGELYKGVPGTGKFSTWRFEEMEMPMRMPGLERALRRADSKSTWELIFGNQTGPTDPQARLSEQAELQARIAGPLMTIVLGVLAVPLSRLRPRQGRYANMGIALLSSFLYLLLARLGANWIESTRVPAAIGLWWLHALVLVVAVGLLLRQDPLRSDPVQAGK
jgi:lipopolysaccharide export system permease protein